MPGTADEELIVEARLRDLLTPAIGKMSNKVKAGFDGMADRARKAQSKMRYHLQKHSALLHYL